jgi:hypothetical protein
MDAFFPRFDRVCFLEVLGAWTFSWSTSADTSSIQRTRRPARAAGILIARFGTAPLTRPRMGAIHVPVDLIGKLEKPPDGWLQNGAVTPRIGQ